MLQAPAHYKFDDDVPMVVVTQRTAADELYRAGARAAGAITLGLMGLIGFFLLYRSREAFSSAGWRFFTEQRWSPPNAFGIAALLVGTIVIAVVALVVAFPIAAGTALYITEYAPLRVRRPLTSLVDLLAAIPSLIYGIWGAAVLSGRVANVSRFFADHFSWVRLPALQLSFWHWYRPFQTVSNAGFTASSMLAGIVVALMVLPICTAIMREVFSQAPQGERESALALGGTRWGVIRDVVLPFGKGGMIGGAMLGLGRALGETIAVAIIISPKFDIHSLLQPLQTGGNSIAAHIALRWPEQSAGGVPTSSLMAAGLVLFVMTLAVNMVASLVVARSRSGSATEI